MPIINSTTKSDFENPLYYLKNFQLVLDWVIERYDDVLIEGEQGSSFFVNRYCNITRKDLASVSNYISDS
jgi:hypothetical protein